MATVAEPKVPEESAEKRREKETAELERTFQQAVAEYCRVRNQQAKRIDALRELRGEAEQFASAENEGKHFNAQLYL